MQQRDQLEQLTANYRTAFDSLSDAVGTLNWEITELKTQHLPDIKERLNQVKTCESQLQEMIVECKNTFSPRRTLVFHGIKIGFQKKKGILSFATNAVQLIRAKLKDQADTLIIVKESVSKTAAAHLSEAQIKSIGGEITADADVIVIKTTDSCVDKLVTQLLASKDDSITL